MQSSYNKDNEQKKSPAAMPALPTGGDVAATKSNAIEIPQISLPKGGGAIKGIDEKFEVNAANGTISFGVPLPIAGGRGFSPSLSLQYNSGAGSSVFGRGWNAAIPSVSRKTDKQLPQYRDEADIFIIAGAEDYGTHVNSGCPMCVWRYSGTGERGVSLTNIHKYSKYRTYAQRLFSSHRIECC